MDNEEWTLSAEIAAYETVRSKLETDYNGKWVVVHHGKVAGTFESFEKAADDAVARFGAGPYLIRQIGASPATIPTAVVAQRAEPVSSV